MDCSDRKRLLLVEDEAIIALAEKRSLERFGYQVENVLTGNQAVERCLRDPQIDLVLMDIDLGSGMASLPSTHP